MYDDFEFDCYGRLYREDDAEWLDLVTYTEAHDPYETRALYELNLRYPEEPPGYEDYEPSPYDGTYSEE